MKQSDICLISSVCAGGANSREWRTTRPGWADRALSGPSRIRITCRCRTQPARFQSSRPSAKHDPRDSISHAISPAWSVTCSDHFPFGLRATAPPPRNSEATTCSSARAQRCLWVDARCPQAACEVESTMPLYRRSDTVGTRGLRNALIRRISRHDKN